MSKLTEVEVTHVKALRVVGLRCKVQAYPEEGTMWQKLTAVVEGHQLLEPRMSIHYKNDEGSKDIDIEVACPVAPDFKLPTSDERGITVRTLDEIPKAASVQLEGACSDLYQAWTNVHEWLSANHAEVIGPFRQIYLSDTNGDLESGFRAQVLVPIK